MRENHAAPEPQVAPKRVEIDATLPTGLYEAVDDLWIVTAYFNPAGYRTRRANHDLFAQRIVESGLRLLTVECALGEAAFELPESPDVLRVRARRSSGTRSDCSTWASRACRRNARRWRGWTATSCSTIRRGRSRPRGCSMITPSCSRSCARCGCSRAAGGPAIRIGAASRCRARTIPPRRTRDRRGCTARRGSRGRRSAASLPTPACTTPWWWAAATT